MEASGIINWKRKMLHYAFLVGFACCTCSCVSGLIAVWFPEPTRVTGSLGRCDPMWQMEYTNFCAGDLWRKKKTSVAQPTKASSRLPISGSASFQKVFMKECEADGSKGHIPCHFLSSKTWQCSFWCKGAHPFSPPVLCESVGSILGFPAVGSAAHLELGRTSDLAVGQRCLGNSCTKKQSGEFHWFCLSRKATRFMEKKEQHWRMQ